MKKLTALQSLAVFGALNGIFTEKPMQIPNRILNEPETEAQKAQRRGLKQWEYEGKIVYAATRKKAFKLFQQKFK